MTPINTVLMMPRTNEGWLQTSRKFCKVKTSISVTPSPQCDTKVRKAIPDNGTITVNSSQPAISANAIQRHLPSGSDFWRAPLPLIETYLLADFSNQRCSITSGMVTATRQTATAAMIIGSDTFRATCSGDAPATRAASSTSEPRLFKAADAYRYTCGTWVKPAMTTMAGKEYTFQGSPSKPNTDSKLRTHTV